METLVRASGDGVEVARKVNGSYTSTRTLMDSTGFSVLSGDGKTTLSKFGSDRVKLGTNADCAAVEMCNGQVWLTHQSSGDQLVSNGTNNFYICNKGQMLNVYNNFENKGKRATFLLTSKNDAPYAGMLVENGEEDKSNAYVILAKDASGGDFGAQVNGTFVNVNATSKYVVAGVTLTRAQMATAMTHVTTPGAVCAATTASTSLSTAWKDIPVSAVVAQSGSDFTVASNKVRCNFAGWVLVTGSVFVSGGGTDADNLQAGIIVGSERLAGANGNTAILAIAPTVRKVASGTYIGLIAANWARASGTVKRGNDNATVLTVVRLS